MKAPEGNSAAADAADAGGDGKQQKKEKKAKKERAPAPAKAAEAEPTVDVLDLRVGRIVKVEQHPNAEALYVEDIDLGEDKPRQVRLRFF